MHTSSVLKNSALLIFLMNMYTLCPYKVANQMSGF